MLKLEDHPGCGCPCCAVGEEIMKEHANEIVQLRSVVNDLLEHYLNVYDGNKDELAIRASKLLEG